jgi:ribosomal subunit interface protein
LTSSRQAPNRKDAAGGCAATTSFEAFSDETAIGSRNENAARRTSRDGGRAGAPAPAGVEAGGGGMTAMSLRVSGKNLAIGEALRQHVQEKVEAAIGRYFNGQIGGHVVISPEGSWYRCDCALHLSSGMDLQAEGKAQEPYASFDQAADRIERRLRRYNKRLKERHAAANEGSEADSAGRPTVTRYLIEAPDEEAEEGQDYSPVIVAEGSTLLKSLSVASAVAELDLTGAPVVVFQHAGSARVNVVYRRGDGAIGWIDPH